MRVRVCLGAILIPEYLDFHSGYPAPRSRVAARARIMTSLSRCKQRWRRVQVKVLRVSRKRKGFWWSREDTLLFISQYREHEKLFRIVKFKKKSV